jgi:hypothetical protein
MSISAMKQALDALTYIYTQTTEYEEKVMDEAIAVLEQAIAEAEKQEPWVKTYCGGKPNYTTPEQEPVAWRDVAGKTTQYYDYNEDGRGEPLYLHREWVGLTDEEVGTLTVFDGLHHVETPLLAGFARAIEAKLKEKNT